MEEVVDIRMFVSAVVSAAAGYGFGSRDTSGKVMSKSPREGINESLTGLNE